MERNYVEVLFEEMRGKFDLVLEGHAALHAKIDEYRRESNEKHDFTAFQVIALKDRIDTVEQTLSARIDTVEQTLSARIDAVEQSLTTRIDAVEQNLTAHIEAVADNLAAHRADTEAHPRYLVRE
jgi:primosomal protein N''